MSEKILGLDFDGTCVTHAYPNIGKEIGAPEVLHKFIAAGWKICLNTMRSGRYMDDAVEWFEKHAIPLYGLNVNPTQHTWTKSTKVYATLYIDDAALGCPLVCSANQRPYVNWETIDRYLSSGQLG